MASKKPDIGRVADMLQTYETVSAFLGWLEDEGYEIRAPSRDVEHEDIDMSELAVAYAADNKAERETIRELLKNHGQDG